MYKKFLLSVHPPSTLYIDFLYSLQWSLFYWMFGQVTLILIVIVDNSVSKVSKVEKV